MRPLLTVLVLKQSVNKHLSLSGGVQYQGRNMVYPTPIDPYFLAVTLIPEPHFPHILIPEP